MNTNENKKKKSFFKSIMLSIILIAIVIAGGIAYARYITMFSGNSSEKVAKWSFNYKILDSTQETEVTNFAVTRTDSNSGVKELTIAPGTNGQFIVEIDATRNRNVANL